MRGLHLAFPPVWHPVLEVASMPQEEAQGREHLLAPGPSLLTPQHMDAAGSGQERVGFQKAGRKEPSELALPPRTTDPDHSGEAAGPRARQWHFWPIPPAPAVLKPPAGLHNPDLDWRPGSSLGREGRELKF